MKITSTHCPAAVPPRSRNFQGRRPGRRPHGPDAAVSAAQDNAKTRKGRIRTVLLGTAGGTEDRIQTGLRVAHQTLRPLIVF